MPDVYSFPIGCKHVCEFLAASQLLYTHSVWLKCSLLRFYSELITLLLPAGKWELPGLLKLNEKNCSISAGCLISKSFKFFKVGEPFCIISHAEEAQPVFHGGFFAKPGSTKEISIKYNCLNLASGDASYRGEKCPSPSRRGQWLILIEKDTHSGYGYGCGCAFPDHHISANNTICGLRTFYAIMVSHMTHE